MNSYQMGKNVKQSIEKAHKSVPPESLLGLEMLEILCSYYFLQKIPFEPNSDNILEYLRLLKIFGLLSDDIILRLCKFRDSDSRNLGFDQVTKELRKHSITSHRIDNIEPLIKKYKVLTQNLESHRDTRIGHLAKRDKTHLKPPIEILEAIQLALQIIDKLSGNQNTYTIEGIELRNIVNSK